MIEVVDAVKVYRRGQSEVRALNGDTDVPCCEAQKVAPSPERVAEIAAVDQRNRAKSLAYWEQRGGVPEGFYKPKVKPRLWASERDAPGGVQRQIGEQRPQALVGAAGDFQAGQRAERLLQRQPARMGAQELTQPMALRLRHLALGGRDEARHGLARLLRSPAPAQPQLAGRQPPVLQHRQQVLQRLPGGLAPQPGQRRRLDPARRQRQVAQAGPREARWGGALRVCGPVELQIQPGLAACQTQAQQGGRRVGAQLQARPQPSALGAAGLVQQGIEIAFGQARQAQRAGRRGAGAHLGPEQARLGGQAGGLAGLGGQVQAPIGGRQGQGDGRQAAGEARRQREVGHQPGVIAGHDQGGQAEGRAVLDAVRAGATTTVTFDLGPDQLRYWSAVTRDWVQDATEIEVYVGGDSTAELTAVLTVD